VRDYRTNTSVNPRLACQQYPSRRATSLPEPFSSPPAHEDTAIRAHCPQLGRTRWSRQRGLWDPFDGRTKVAQIYKKTGNLRRCSCFSGTPSTVRYLGIEVDAALSISEQIEL
jgi:hypothetical protein